MRINAMSEVGSSPFSQAFDCDKLFLLSPLHSNRDARRIATVAIAVKNLFCSLFQTVCCKVVFWVGLLY